MRQAPQPGQLLHEDRSGITDDAVHVEIGRFVVGVSSSVFREAVETELYVYFGTAGQDLAALLAGDVPDAAWFFWVGLGATLVLTVVITRIATTALTTRLARLEP